MIDNKTLRELADGNFEETEHGLFVAKSRGFVVGQFHYNKRGEPVEVSFNEVVLEGLNYILGASLAGISAINTWYIAPFSGDVAVQSSWEASNFATAATEFTNYTGASRPTWSNGSVAAGAVNSFSSKAEIVSSVDSATIRGAGMISTAGKGSTTGVLLAASRFPSAKNLDTDEALEIGYGLELQPVT